MKTLLIVLVCALLAGCGDSQNQSNSLHPKTNRAEQIITGFTQPTPEDYKELDVAPMVNGVSFPDGKIDIEDIVVLLRMETGAI